MENTFFSWQMVEVVQLSEFLGGKDDPLANAQIYNNDDISHIKLPYSGLVSPWSIAKVIK